MDQDALSARCALCRTVHHTTCFDERRGCSVDGCAGRAAHVVKGWRAALGECRACSAKVYLDENVALCKWCEARHHPACLEARAGCAECSSGEGIIVSAQAFQSAAQRGRRWSSAAFAFALLCAAIAGTAALVAVGPLRDPLLRIALVAGGLLLGVASFALALRLHTRIHRRALDTGVPPIRPAAPTLRKDAPAGETAPP